MNGTLGRSSTGLLRRLAHGAGLAVAGLCLIGGAAGEELKLVTTLSRDQLVRNFDTIVFHNEFDRNEDSRLRKWADPLRIYLDVRAGDPGVILDTVSAHIAHLAEITGHDIALTEDVTQANTTVVFERDGLLDAVKSDYFAPDFDIRTVMQTNLCIGQYRSNSSYEINKAVVVIPIDRVMSRGRLRACVIEELTQVLGLPNDSDTVFPSVFNDHSPDVDLSPQDVLLIKLLYDARLTVGMPRAAAVAEVREILADWGIKELRIGATDG